MNTSTNTAAVWARTVPNISPLPCIVRLQGKTFFCYGGAKSNDNTALVHMVSFFDHRTGTVPRPTFLLDKHTEDAHDNPVISVDDAGYIWIFSTSHGVGRPSFIHRSVAPYSIEAFEPVHAVQDEDSGTSAITNFSYMQAWHRDEAGFACFYTRYGDPARRTLFFMSSPDGVRWNQRVRLAAIEGGHYGISAVGQHRAGMAFDVHPALAENPLNWRTNLYYLQTPDNGSTWTTADGTVVTVPLTTCRNPALVADYQSRGLNVYIKDIAYDTADRPVILYLTSKGYACGPENAPRIWHIAQWIGSTWRITEVTTSDNNYDMGSLYIEDETNWRIVAPTIPGAQPYNPGGEMALWLSTDAGSTWHMARRMTHDSDFNHTFARRPVNVHPEFYAFWADGHARQPSASRLYFCNRDGDVFRLPRVMHTDTAVPERIT